MKITFPRLGFLATAGRLYLESLGLEVIVPPQNSRASLEKGKAISPEEMCLPFKLMAGNLIEAYNKGAQTVLMAATAGPCRLGEYGELLKEVLDVNGYKMQWIIIDAPKVIGKREFFKRLASVAEGKNVKLGTAIVNGAKIVKLIFQRDKMMCEAGKLSGSAAEPDLCVNILSKTDKAMEQSKSIAEAQSILKANKKELYNIPGKRRKPVLVTLTGEIYSMIEPFANQNIEEKIMRMGVSLKKDVSLSWWIKNAISFKSPYCKYMKYRIGGYARETVNEIFTSAKKTDGVIKIMPAGCMPEIVAKSVSEKMAKSEDLKILNIVYDEMSGEGGYDTRLEAFVDMLERRRYSEDVFFGN